MRQMGIKDKDGKLLTDSEQVLNRWKTHTANMYNKPEDQSDRRRLLHRRTEDKPTPLVKEVWEAIKKLKNQKSPGCDGIPAELWKATGQSGIRLMHMICNMIWRTRQSPTEWTKLVLVPIPKSGDLKDCFNYRNVSLFCHASRVLLHIIVNRLQQYSERQLPHKQTWFRAGRGTRDALFIMEVMIKKLIDLENKKTVLDIYWSHGHTVVWTSVVRAMHEVNGRRQTYPSHHTHTP